MPRCKVVLNAVTVVRYWHWGWPGLSAPRRYEIGWAEQPFKNFLKFNLQLDVEVQVALAAWAGRRRPARGHWVWHPRCHWQWCLRDSPSTVIVTVSVLRHRRPGRGPVTSSAAPLAAASGSTTAAV